MILLKGQDINRQLMLLAVLPALMLFVLLISLLTWQRFADVDSELHEQGRFISRQLAVVSEYGMLSGNTDELKNQARMAMENQRVLYVVYRNLDGDVILYQGRNENSVKPPDQEQVRLYHAGIYQQPLLAEDHPLDFLSDMRFAGLSEYKIGEISVAMDVTSLYEKQRDIVLASIGPAAVAIFMAFLIARKMASRFSSPIVSLSRLVRQIREGDYDARGHFPLQGELSQLQEDINDLAYALGRTQEEYDGSITALRKATQSAQAANKAKSEFLAMMSHELRTPMNGVLGMLQLLESTSLDEMQSEYAKAAVQSTTLLLDVINDILDFSRIESGRLDLEKFYFPLFDAIENAVSAFRYAADKKGIELDLIMDEGLRTVDVRSDPTRLRQVLGNLIANAIKFTETGGVTVQVHASFPLDEFVDLTLFVRDTGIGIPEERLATLFDAFSQVDSSTSRRFGGTGLGLAIAKRLTDMLEGTMEVQSQEGEGSCFICHFSLPFRQRVEALPTEEAQEAIPRLSGRVLLVEDNYVNSLVAERMLQSSGVEVVCAENGHSALEYLQREHFDCVFMDIQMPVMDGLEATRKLRQWESRQGQPPVPVIALTANAMVGERERCLETGMNDYLAKPFHRKKLLALLERYLTVGEQAGAGEDSSR